MEESEETAQGCDEGSRESVDARTESSGGSRDDDNGRGGNMDTVGGGGSGSEENPGSSGNEENVNGGGKKGRSARDDKGEQDD